MPGGPKGGSAVLLAAGIALLMVLPGGYALAPPAAPISGPAGHPFSPTPVSTPRAGPTPREPISLPVRAPSSPALPGPDPIGRQDPTPTLRPSPATALVASAPVPIYTSGWSPLNLSAGPSARTNASIAFDATDGYDLMFGGYSGTYHQGTWELKGNTWTAAASAANPSAREEEALAYDAADGYVLLFGGYDGAYLGDTWAFRGGQWTELMAPAHGPDSGSTSCYVYTGGTNSSTQAACPSARYGSSMAFDASGGHLVLFGGYNGTAQGDTWVFQGGVWTRLPPSTPNPAPRYAAAMAYDAADGMLVLFGGEGLGLLGDTWTFRAGNWTAVTSSAQPSPRMDAGMTFSSGNASVLLYGGLGAGILGDTWSFRAGAWTALGLPTVPTPRYGAVMTYDPADGYVLLWGGQNASGYLQGPWGFKTAPQSGWVAQSTSALPIGYEGASAYDEADGVVVAFGGQTTNYQQSTWIYRSGIWEELEAPQNGPGSGSLLCWDYRGGVNSSVPATCPPAREGAAMTYDEHDGELVLFGGYNGNFLGDTWTFKGTTWTEVEAADTGDTCWTNPPVDTTTGPCPSPRESPAMSYDPALGEVILFGGNSGHYRNDTWAFADGGWTELTPAAPIPNAREQANLVYDEADGYLLLFGGIGCPNPACSPYSPLNDTWSFTRDAWTELTPAGEVAPTPRYATAMTYDASDGYVLLSGGFGCSSSSCSNILSLNDTWTYRGDAWTQENLSPAPAPRYGGIFSYDPQMGFSLLSAGYDGSTYFTDVWSYVRPFGITSLTATPASLDLTQSTRLSTSTLGGNAPYTYSYQLPAGCTSADLPAISCTPSATGRFVVTVTVSDGTGLTLSNSTPIDVYDLPAITAIHPSRPSADVGQPVNFTAIPAPTSSPAESFKWAWGAGLGCAATTAPVLACAATAPGAAYWVEVNMTDPTGATSANVTLSPYSISPAPATSRPVASPTRMDTGQSLSLTATLIDPGNGTDTYTWNGLPSSCPTVDALSIGPCPIEVAGTLTVTLSVTDSDGDTTQNGSAQVEVEVAPSLLEPLANRSSADVGQPVGFEASVTGGSPPLRYNWTSSSPDLGCLSVNASSIGCLPTEPGNYTVALRVTDAVGVTTENTSAPFRVYALPALATFTPARYELDAGERIALTSALEDPGSGGVDFRLSTLPVGVSCSLQGAGADCTFDRVGNFSLTLVATDANGGSASATSRPVRVYPDPTVGAPTVSEGTVPLGSSVGINVSVSGGVGNYSVAWLGLPAGCSSILTAFSCTPTAGGSYEISVTVTDGSGYNVSSVQTALNITSPSPAYGQSSGGDVFSVGFLALLIGIVVLVSAAVGLRMDHEGREDDRKSGRWPHFWGHAGSRKARKLSSER